MKFFTVEFTASAEADFDAIIDHISADNPKRAFSFVDELRDLAIRILTQTPHAGAPIGRYRYLVRGNYVTVYRVDDEGATVYVLLVTEAHCNWRPAFED